jgi:C-methyltransferase C-terminal domain/Putative zinc binding domain/Methyltransferase domain
MNPTPLCRFCSNPLQQTFADLGMSPISNAFIPLDRATQAEKFYPLHAYVCDRCLLVQLEEFETPTEIFNDHYAYFSSYSKSWLAHAQQYVEGMVDRLQLNAQSQVIEIASNDGYLLQYFQAKNIPVLGIEPAANVAAAAEAKGIRSLVEFFSVATARSLIQSGQKPADLLLGNNVLAHVPDLNDFVAGMKILLAPEGTITMEFPHLLNLMEQNQFDTIYHEHFSYFSLLAVEQVFARHGLTLFDVEELPTHGGSLRIFGQHQENLRPVSAAIEKLQARERAAGLDVMATYGAFAKSIQRTKRRLLAFLIEAQESGKQVVGYGAPAKGNTLLNYCGVKSDLLAYTVDVSPHKQGMLLPGTRIPVYDPAKILETQPDYVLILPWNIREEIMNNMAAIREWGGKFVVPIPTLTVLD